MYNRNLTLDTAENLPLLVMSPPSKHRMVKPAPSKEIILSLIIPCQVKLGCIKPWPDNKLENYWKSLQLI